MTRRRAASSRRVCGWPEPRGRRYAALRSAAVRGKLGAMYLKSRGGRWYAFAHIYDAERDRRTPRKKSTGVHDDGTAAAKNRARLIGAEWERRLAAGLDRTKAPTLVKAMQARLQALEVRGAPQSTRDRVLYSAQQLFVELGPDTPIDTLSTEKLLEYASTRLAAGVSADTIRRELSDLRAAIVAVGGKCPPLPKLAKSKPRQRWLTPDECGRLLEAAPAERKRAILVALQTGVRRGELFMLRRIAPGVGRLVGGVGLKTGERTIPLTPLADAALAAGPLEPWLNAARDLKAIARKAKLGPVSWNDLRRTTATQLVLAGVSTAKTAALLGHTSTRMVEAVYARVASLDVTVADLAALPDYSVE